MLTAKDSVATIEKHKMRFSNVVMDTTFCVVSDSNLANFDGTIGLNFKSSIGFIGQIQKKYPELPQAIGFFLRNSFWHPTSSITLGGTFSDLIKGKPFFFHSPNPFHFPIQRVVIRDAKNDLIKLFPASSIQLTLDDFYIQANPEDYKQLVMTGDSLIPETFRIHFEIDVEKEQGFIFSKEQLYELRGYYKLASYKIKGLHQNPNLKQGEFVFGRWFFIKYMQMFHLDSDVVWFFPI